MKTQTQATGAPLGKVRRWLSLAVPRRLFWRIYLYGFLLLVAVAFTVIFTGRLIQKGPPHWQQEQQRVARYLARDLVATLDEPTRLKAKLETLAEVFEADLVVYRADGTVVANAGDLRPEPESSAPTDRRVSLHRTHARMVLPLGEGPAVPYLVVQRKIDKHLPKLMAVILAVLGALAVVSFPLARTIVRPLEKLTHAARALGKGDLRARSGLVRRDEVGVLANAFDDMAARIQRLVLSEREMIANISHELKTPLARIRVALELCDPAITPPAENGEDSLHRHLKGIGGDLTELERLVDDVLVMARLESVADGPESDGLRLRRQSVGLDTVFAGSVQRFRDIWPKHELVVQLAPDLGQLAVDPSLLRRAIDNVLDNAGRYAEPQDGPITLTAMVSGEELFIEVHDRGVGVDATDLPRLFEPFFRTDRSRTRHTGGIGLGLPLCRRILEAHGGSIEAERAVERGLIIRMRLPR